MTAFYFLSGLGANSYHAKAFLESLPMPVHYLGLPETVQSVTDLQAFEAWFEAQVNTAEDMILMGHSIGGDFVAYLANRYLTVKALVLLDGGFYNMDKIQPLADELEEAKAYMEQTCYKSMDEAIQMEKDQAGYWSDYLEQAVSDSLVAVDGKYRLKLDCEAVLGLLRLRRECQGAIHRLQDLPVGLILPDLGAETPPFKQEALAALPAHVKQSYVPNCGHNLYTENPYQVARAVMSFLEEVESYHT